MFLKACSSIQGYLTGGACTVTDDCLESDCWNDPCDGCGYLRGPGPGGAFWPEGMSGDISGYWSSSPIADTGNTAWSVYFDSGDVYYDYLDFHNFARCVR